MAHQLSLSFELILLFEWFLKGGRKKLEALVNEAVDTDIVSKLKALQGVDVLEEQESLHGTVLEFISFLEVIMLEELDKRGVELPPRGDEALLDYGSLWLSVQKEKDQKKEPGELLRRLLKNWKPDSEESVN